MSKLVKKMFQLLKKSLYSTNFNIFEGLTGEGLLQSQFKPKLKKWSRLKVLLNHLKLIFGRT